MYLEFRGILPDMYDLEGNTYEGVQVVGIYYETVQKFKKDYPDFQGARYIYAPRRKVDNTTVDGYVELCLKFLELYPDFVAGFDLVGQEDLGYPLIDFIPQLLKLKDKGTKFFFHAGETNWNGESTDLNLFDAILLNTTRIGHGYAILKHPALYDVVKERKIALEISPISNQVLKLVDDHRNHPGSILIANNFPVVITSDDPSFWGSNGLSYDWYFAFMGMASRNEDLRFLKQLAMNSIEFSAMEEAEKEAAYSKWRSDWEKFVDDILVDTPTVINIR
uniref:Adenosine deaminase n=2 Tax=Anoplophora glabripennis TaxID=217634 RepID=V5GQC6_ANOGL